MNQYSAAVLLRNADGRTHSVAVVLTTSSPEDAITHAEHLALRTVWEQPAWSVESSWLFDQHVISAEYRGPAGGDPAMRVAPAADPADDWPNAHGRRVDHAGNAY